MRASTHKIQATDTGVAGLRAEGQDIEEGVAEAEDGALVEVEGVLPVRRRVDFLVHDEGCYVSAGARGDGAEDGGAGVLDHGGPVLGGGGGVGG